MTIANQFPRRKDIRQKEYIIFTKKSKSNKTPFRNGIINILAKGHFLKKPYRSNLNEASSWG